MVRVSIFLSQIVCLYRKPCHKVFNVSSGSAQWSCFAVTTTFSYYKTNFFDSFFSQKNFEKVKAF